MSANNALVAFIVGFAILTTSLSGGTSEAKTKRTHNRHLVRKPAGCPNHRTAAGELVDCHGWRYRTGYGWDNTCINLDYLPSQFACSSNDKM